MIEDISERQMRVDEERARLNGTWKESKVETWLGIVFAIPSLTAMFLFFGAILKSLIEWLFAGRSPFAKATLVLVVVVVGAGMYCFKKTLPISYGVVAVSFGLFLAIKVVWFWHHHGSPLDLLGDLAALGAAAYAIARGADDIDTGVKKRAPLRPLTNGPAMVPPL
jgi:hypothetical protein